MKIIDYSKLDGMSSCQTKMVLGYRCGSGSNEHVVLTNTLLLEAKRRLNEDFAFIVSIMYSYYILHYITTLHYFTLYITVLRYILH